MTVVSAVPRPPRRIPWPALVALAYTVAQLALVVPHLGLGWDETVYVSQVDPGRPAAYFSAPRSRGISLLAAPVLAVTHSTTVLRIVLALLSAAALYAAYRVWQPLLGRARTALAALLFASLWTTVLYGPQAMPNLWVALSAVAAVGWFLRAVHLHERRRALLGLGAMVAAATCFRFSDGVWLALPLLAACAIVPAWRRPAPALAVAGGFAMGGAEWVAEADAFGYAHVRRVERALIQEYRETVLGALAAARPAADLDAVVELAELPDMVRGYERIKLDNVDAYHRRRSELLEQLRPAPVQETPTCR
ncbi:DUF6537 domain-containing protein [Streptomyces malaysiensis]|uniref:DUF6537 domain-containing protein n=1 Tax=Streptomyces malaysiensis TaxID=92644 RepID=UPI0037216188